MALLLLVVGWAWLGNTASGRQELDHSSAPRRRRGRVEVGALAVLPPHARTHDRSEPNHHIIRAFMNTFMVQNLRPTRTCGDKAPPALVLVVELSSATETAESDPAQCGSPPPSLIAWSVMAFYFKKQSLWRESVAFK